MDAERFFQGPVGERDWLARCVQGDDSIDIEQGDA